MWRKLNMRKSVLEWLIAIVIGLLLAWVVSTFLLTRYTVQGESMYPTFEDNDELLVNKTAKTLNRWNRGDVVIFHADEKRDYIKRLIGKPGDKVSYKKDKLYINGKYVKEPYLKYNKRVNVSPRLTEDFDVSDIQHSHGRRTIPKDKYLVLGDNRAVSNDSRRDLGLVSKDKMVGKVFMRVAPFDEFKVNFYPKSFDKVN